MLNIHLIKDSTEPPKVPGKLRVYSMKYCPFAQRTRLVLLAKKIDHDVVNCNLKNKPEFLFKYHPEGKVPALYVNEEEVLIESLEIGDYLNEKYPDPPLYPADPTAKQADIELINNFNKYVEFFYRSLFIKENDENTKEEWLREFTSILEPFESALKSRGTPFFNGYYPGMLDYNIWPWIERVDIVKNIFGKAIVGEQETPFLKRWSDAMLDDPVVIATHIDPKICWEFIQKYVKNDPFDVDDL